MLGAPVPLPRRADGGGRRGDVHGTVAFAELYGANGLQFLPFNTVYQLAAERDAGMLDVADTALLVPDLIALLADRCAASPRPPTRRPPGSSAPATRRGGTPDCSPDSASRRPSSRPSSSRAIASGRSCEAVAAEVGLPASTPVTAVGSHDTASAVVAVPMTTPDAAYISCGTWGLVGVELERPVLTEASRAANFTNEGGVDGRIRFLHNVMGLWLLSESVRTWERGGETIDLPGLIAQAAAVDAPVSVFDANDPRFLAPGDLPARIAEFLVEHGRAVPQSRAEFVRCIIESLAQAFADAVHTASELSGVQVRAIHVVGGGSQNTLLCQLTADRAGIPVIAGPVEATALGNVLVQARAVGIIDGDLETLRALVARSFEPTRYEPRKPAGSTTVSR